MYEIGMMYEIGKQRMQKFIEDAERARVLKMEDTILYRSPMEKVNLNLSSDAQCC